MAICIHKLVDVMTSFKVRCYLCGAFVDLKSNGAMKEHYAKYTNRRCRASDKYPR